MKKLYDGGILVLIGIVLVAFGIAAIGAGVKNSNDRTERARKRADKPLVIPLPPQQEHAPYDVPIPSESTPPLKEEQVVFEEANVPSPVMPMTPAMEESPWYWPF